MSSDRQENLGLQTDTKILLAGCGGVGSWVALFLVLAGVKEFILSDHDILESHNLNRLPYILDRCGDMKVDVLGDYLNTIREDLIVTRITEPMDPDLLDVLWDSHTVVDCTDVFETQLKLYSWAEEKGARYIRVGVTTNHITLTSRVKNVWDIEKNKEARCGVIIPAWVAPCTLVASYAVAKILKFPELELSMEISDG